MNRVPRAELVCGLVTGALLGVATAMALAPSSREREELRSRGQGVLDAARGGLAPLPPLTPV